MRIVKKHWVLTLFLIFYAGIIGYKIIFHPTPYYDWDESLYVQTGKEMIDAKIFYVPVWQKELWLDKAPLVSLFYGLIDRIPFIQSEIATRLAALTLSLVNLLLIYILSLRVIKDRLIVTLAVAATSFAPLFLQRAQTVNADVFVLLGWVGYLLFFRNFILGLLFLASAVLSKSLIGFYPIALIAAYYLYELWRKKVKTVEIWQVFKQLFTHVAILAAWYVGMFIAFGNRFFQMHIIESHFRRVSSSIEFHFGQRTFYIDLIREQYGLLFFLAVIGLFFFVVSLRKNKWNTVQLLHGLYLLPWFLFLNLTKTKIFWYIYPSLPQFAFLSVFPLTQLKKKGTIYYFTLLIFVVFVLQQAFVKQKLLTTYYSQYEPHHELAQYAKNQCRNLTVLLGEENRKGFATLDTMGLLITTTKWWGNHPSIVYYSGKKVMFIYDKNEMKNRIAVMKKGECAVVEKTDLDLPLKSLGLESLKSFDYLALYRHR